MVKNSEVGWVVQGVECPPPSTYQTHKKNLASRTSTRAFALVLYLLRNFASDEVLLQLLEIVKRQPTHLFFQHMQERICVGEGRYRFT